MPTDHYHEAVAVTGIGMITGQGIGRETSWKGIAAGQASITPWPHLLPGMQAPPRVAAAPSLPCPDDLRPSFWQGLSRVQQLACLTVDEALKQADLPRHLDGYSAACLVSSSVCAMDMNEKFYIQYRDDPNHASLSLLKRVHPFELPKLVIKRHRMTGPHYMNLTTCVGSAAAIGAALDIIRCGLAPIAVVGGFDSLCQLLVSGFGSLRLISSTGCRPFSPDRDGILPGEAGAVLVMESVAHARERSMEPLGYICGYGATADAFHITKPDPEAVAAEQAIRASLADAGITLSEMDYVNCHGTGTRDNDAMEMQLYTRIFGDASPVITSTKHLTGHTFAAGGALETAISLLAMRDGCYPPGPGPRGMQAPDGDGKGGRKINRSLICNFAFGGNNTAIVAARSPEK
ncbi:MAG: beta-ketoacyl-[acyl-carrier-protein] synthase family protein [Phycisphaerae bacterium]